MVLPFGPALCHQVLYAAEEFPEELVPMIERCYKLPGDVERVSCDYEACQPPHRSGFNASIAVTLA